MHNFTYIRYGENAPTPTNIASQDFDMDLSEIYYSQAGSETAHNVSSSIGAETQQNVDFVEDTSPFTYDASAVFDATRSSIDSNPYDLDEFFSRPVNIFKFTWTVNDPMAFTINPWYAFFTNKRVSNRLVTFNLLKANLHLKIVLNGTPFHMGRLIVAYQPAALYDQALPNTTVYDDVAYLPILTQWPHVLLDPTTSTGGDIICPMFWHKDYLHIPEDDQFDMGSLIIKTINPLQHAMGEPTSITVSIYAWATDVSMSGLTRATQSVMVSQMGEVEEARDGYISTKLTSVSKFASLLQNVPYISPYAIATSKAAAGLSMVARAFGYSRPVVNIEPMSTRSKYVSGLAPTNVPDMSQKLTVDSKQELTIDPRIAGLPGYDTMAITSIASREAYYDTFNWTMDGVSPALLWNMRIDPNLRIIATTKASLPSAMLPCCVASLPFKYWSGTMKIRFQAVCTAYHKGRLRIVYDPNETTLNPESNTSHTCIHDIQASSEFTVSVAMAQPTAFVQRAPIDTSPSLMRGPLQLFQSTYGNGTLAVYIETDLVGPSQPSSPLSIAINVYVSFEDDFEVACPTDDFAAYVPDNTFLSQMGEYNPTAIKNYTVMNDPAPTNSVLINGPKLTKDHLNEVYFGERITSFRQLVKRYTMWRSFANAGDISNTTVHSYSFPLLRGSYPTGIDNNSTYTYANMNLIHWITLCHQGWRGAMRYKAVPVQGSRDFNSSTLISVARNVMADRYFDQGRPRVPIPNQRTAARIGTYDVMNPPWDNVQGAFPFGDSSIIGPGNAGMALSGGFDKVLEFEVPYAVNNRFCIGKRLDWVSDSITGELPGFDLSIMTRSDSHGFTSVFVAAGEDFQCFFWTGMPLMKFSPTIPAPT